MDLLILIVIGLLSFLSSIPAEEDDKCLNGLENGTCTCCKSGYRGQTCNVSCERCESRFFEKCEYFCEDGYYGPTCNKPCPEPCAIGAQSKRRVCKEENGLPVCIECIQGHYGRQCKQICNENCHDTRCLITDGSCLDCRNSQSYGDYCNISCSEGCKNNKCNRTGHCTDGCSDGFFGGKCMECGGNCVQAICISDKYSTYNCTEGCIDGYTGTNCTEKCQPHCKKCDHQGKCKSCVEHYVLNDDTWECLTVRNISTPIKRVNHIHIALGVVLPILILCGVIIGVVIWKKKRPNVSGLCIDERKQLKNNSDENNLQLHTFSREQHLNISEETPSNDPKKRASFESDVSSMYHSDDNLQQKCFITRKDSNSDDDLNSNISSPYQSNEELNQVCLINHPEEYGNKPDNSRSNQRYHLEAKNS